MTVPTMNKMVKVYVDAASVERLKCGRPSEGTVSNTIGGLRRFRAWINQRREDLGHAPFAFPISKNPDDSIPERYLADDSPLVSIVKPQLIHRYLADMLKRGTNPVTAQSYVFQLQQLFAKWVLPYYEDRGWKIPAFPPLVRCRRSARYVRPSSQQLAKIKTWYDELSDKMNAAPTSSTSSLWFAATMMLEFAMRNGDIQRLGNNNFVEHNGRIYLNYTPNKTKNSSGRMVKWPVHPKLWAFLKDNSLCCDRATFTELNKILRGLGFTGTKGAYELRKICIDHVYQKFGAEMATSISGDDIRTIMHYYADPAQPNIGEVMVTDLL